MEIEEKRAWERELEEVESHESLIRRLPKMQQEVLLIVLYHDMTLKEAAQEVQLHIEIVRTHYDRGKKKLKEWIEIRKIFDVLRNLNGLVNNPLCPLT